MIWYKLFDSEAEACTVLSIGESKLIIAGEHRICLSRTKTGFFAIKDACPHLGAPLSKGTLNEWDEIVCPWHSYRYRLDKGTECENRSAKAKTYSIKIDSEGFFIEA